MSYQNQMVKSAHDRETTMILIIFATLIQTAECGRLSCNPEQFAERGKPFVLTCKATHSVTDFYWYKGEDISDFPILVYENGNQRGKEYQRGEYELTSNFSLKIIDTQVKHEGSYTVRTYFPDDLFEDVTTAIRVYDLPSPSCPYVDACGLSCNGCAINMTTSGYLVCYVNGSRPKFDIDWSVDKFVGISSAMQQQFEIYDETSDTWYTKRNISYNIDRCGTNATFHCTVNAPVYWTANILETYSISVQIISGDCQASISMEGTSPGKSNLLLIFLSLVGGGLFLLALFFFVRYRIKKGKKKKMMLITNLLTAYETFYLVKPIPWEEPISISKLYAAPKCTVTDANTSIEQKVSSELLKEDFISKNPRTILVAGMGHGKMSFTKYFVDKWTISQQNENDETRMNQFILFHISLKDVKANELLHEVIKDKLLKDSKLTSGYIDNILDAYTCVVIFSGLDEMSTSCRPNYNDETVELATVTNSDEDNEADRLTNTVGEDNRSKLTIGNILRNTYNKSRYKNMKVWVTTTNIDCLKCEFGTPYCKVTFKTFTLKDIELYIHNTCKHYLESEGRGDELANVEKDVTRLIEMNEIVKNFFFKTPMLRLMFIHITARKLVNVEKYKDVDLNKITTVMKLVMRCFESRYKENNKTTPTIETDIDAVETHLGKVAFKNPNKEIFNRKQDLGEQMTNAAIEIGFMKPSGTIDGSLGKSLLKSPFEDLVFSHAYIKEYLTAQYICENDQGWDRLDGWIQMSDDESTKRFIQCMCGLKHPKVNYLLKALLPKEDGWNMLIDCLYEINDPELQKPSIQEIFEEVEKESPNWAETHIINVRHLARDYHKLALDDFCRICRENGIKLKLGFQEDCAITFLDEVTLPPLMSLVFREMSFDEDQYVSVITSLTDASCNALWFVHCNTPTELSRENEEKVNKMLERTNMKIHLSGDMPPQDTVVH